MIFILFITLVICHTFCNEYSHEQSNQSCHVIKIVIVYLGDFGRFLAERTFTVKNPFQVYFK